jgi:hypothetical protein
MSHNLKLTTTLSIQAFTENFYTLKQLQQQGQLEKKAAIADAATQID